ncbi:MAG: RNA polymerase sigma factor [Gammaproteobacteria bacterium]|nr:RNA polymerase sigma factor [Gammaproteobacteria bacterium]
MTASPLETLTEHRQAVRGFVLRLVGDEALAEDLTQETFVRMQRSASRHRGEASERSWLCAIALNLVRDHFRAIARGPDSTSDSEVVEGIASEREDTEFAVLKKEMSTCIGEHLIQLPRPQYEVVALHDMAGLTHKEIAAQLDISVANARVLLHRGRAAFRKILERNCVLSLGQDAIPCERRPPAARNR